VGYEPNHMIPNLEDKWTNWFNHITKMDHNYFPQDMLSYKPNRKRSLGCPGKRWTNQIWGATSEES